MDICIDSSIFSKLPLDIINKIMSLYYGALDIDSYIKKKKLNKSIVYKVHQKQRRYLV